MSIRSRLIILAVLGAAVAPGSAHAATTCSYDWLNHRVTVAMTASGDVAKISRSGSAIDLNGNACGAATVTNTDEIVWDDQSLGGTKAVVDLSGGPLGPGYSPQLGDSSPTIGMTYDAGTGNDTFTVLGTPQDDKIRIGTGAFDSYVNLDVAAEQYFPDADVDLKSVEIADINGGGGADVIDAGAHSDTGGAPFSGRLYEEGELGDDQLTGGSGITGLMGGAGNDTLVAGSGGASLWPGTGDDTADGGASSHAFVSYSDAPAGVHVDLARTDRQDTGGAESDKLSGIDVLVGSDYDDVLAGTETSDALEGRDGDDLLIGRGGNDELRGGAGTINKDGFDVVSYANPSPGIQTGVTVSLAKQGGKQDTLTEGQDVLYGISGVIGSPFADTLTGDATANRIEGGGGSDTVNAGDGPDTVLLRDGISDHADCGGADDTVESDVAGLDVLTGCENVMFPLVSGQPGGQPGGSGGGSGQPGPSPGAVDTTLTFRFTAMPRQRLGRRGIVKGSLLCPDEACTGEISSKLTVGRTARRAAHTTTQLAAGAAQVVKLRLSARNLRVARAALRRGQRVTLKVTAVARDAAGNRQTVTRTIRLRP
jgi:Ca2+-binding RTX toxin-like protein